MKPLVSVVSTLYNYRDYVVDMIKSVQGQTYQNWELIIIDDASIDDPSEAIKSYLEDKRISYIRFDENRGYSYGRNEGIIRSKGNFIAIVDADDMLTPWSIKVRVAALEAHPQYLWCCAAGKKIGPNGNLLLRKKPRKNRTCRFDDSSHRYIHGGSVMFRREFFKRFGLYDEDLKFSADNELSRRALQLGCTPYYVESFVTLYRQHQQQMHKSEEKHRSLQEVKNSIVSKVQIRAKEGINSKNTRMLEE